MSERDNEQTVRAAYAAFRNGDIASVLAMMTPDAGWYTPGPVEHIPFAGQRRGTGQIADFFAKLAGSQDVELFEPKEFVAQGEKVVALGEYRWKVKATGRSFGGAFAHVFTVQDGKVTNFHEYFDTDAAVSAYRAQVAAVS